MTNVEIVLLGISIALTTALAIALALCGRDIRRQKRLKQKVEAIEFEKDGWHRLSMEWQWKASERGEALSLLSHLFKDEKPLLEIIGIMNEPHLFVIQTKNCETSLFITKEAKEAIEKALGIKK